MTAKRRYVRQISIRIEDDELLEEVREDTSMVYLSSTNGVGASSMIGILAKHWRENPPDPEWVKKLIEDIPKRGAKKNPHSTESGMDAFRRGFNAGESGGW